MKKQLSSMYDTLQMKGLMPVLLASTMTALIVAPSSHEAAYAQSKDATTTEQARPEEEVAKEEQAETPPPDPEFAALTKELEPLILGGWGQVSGLGSAAINDQALVAAFASCRRTSRIKVAKYIGDAEKTVPETDERRGNVVYYKTKKGLQRLDTALRTVVLISKIEKRKDKRRKRQLWVLGTKNGSVVAAFGAMKRNGRSLPIMIEQSSILLRCPQKPKE